MDPIEIIYTMPRCKTEEERKKRIASSKNRYYLKKKEKIKEYNKQYYLKRKLKKLEESKKEN
jgi:hypothetical protein